MKKCIYRNDFRDLSFLELCGVNLLKGVTPAVLDSDGDASGKVELQMKRSAEFIDLITDDTNPKKAAFNNHIDIMTPECTLIYDLHNFWHIDRIYIGGFFNGLSDYSILDYQLYISDNLQNLISRENEIVSYNNSGLFEKKQERNHCDQIFDLEGFGGRYFAIKINKANATDDIIRIGTVAVYNHENTESLTFYEKNFEHNIIKTITPAVKGSYSADLSLLTDGICFDEAHRTTLNADTEFIFKLENPMNITGIAVVGSSTAVDGCTVYLGNDKETVFDNENLTEVETIYKPTSREGVSAAELKIHTENSTRFLGLRFPGGCFIDQIAATSNTNYVNVDLDRVLCDDFISFGANCLPMALMPEAVEKGYNEVYWELERSRIINTRPSVLRLWFQPDWLITTRENYENGIYDFESTKMQSVYHYLDAFKTGGCEIELNFGWKTCKEHADWFAVNKQSEHPWNSAPADLESFAKCCSATLNELILNRGYTNIKYLAFYNESAYGENPISDFNVPDGKPWPYYKKMFLTVMNQLKKDGMLKYVTPWAAEQSGRDQMQWEWSHLAATELEDYPQKITQHRYDYTYDELMPFFARHKSEANGKDMIVSEYGVNSLNSPWDASHVTYSMAIHNSGYSGGLIWTMSGVMITDPCSFMMNNCFDLWWFLPLDAEHISSSFYETCLQMRYIPAHSKSVLTTVKSPDIRAAAFTHGNDITVMVQAKEGGCPKQLKISLPGIKERTFYRHTYNQSVPQNGGAVVIPCDKTVIANGIIEDEIAGEYSMVMYTTITPKKQVAFEKAMHTVSPGEQIALNAKLVDTDENDSLTYKITKATGENIGKVDENGVFTADKKANAGDMVAVTASLNGNDDIFGVTLIKIQ